MKNYLEINRQSWNAKVEPHMKSKFYDVESFIKGRNSIPENDRKLLGDISGKSVLHLQCHFGQDSVSLSRMGAEVTGADISDLAIEAAENLAKTCGTDTHFVCSDLYHLPSKLSGSFDIVYTSYGVIGWLPDLEKWAAVISHFLKPGGKLVFAEFHPFVWMYDDFFDHIEYSYFNEKPIVETVQGTYANPDAEIIQEYVMWNHPTSDVLNAVVRNGLEILSFDEFCYSPFPCFKDVEEVDKGKFLLSKFGNKMPVTFALCAVKKEA